MPAEDIAMGRSPLLDGILERPGNVLLSNHLGEPLWTVFAGQDGVTHEVEEMIIRDWEAIAIACRMEDQILNAADTGPVPQLSNFLCEGPRSLGFRK